MDNINGVNRYECTALHSALHFNEFDLIKLLIENGCNINIQNNDNFTALHLALQLKLDVSIIELILENGADCTLSSIYNTTLNYAIEYNNLMVVKLILTKLLNNGGMVVTIRSRKQQLLME